MALILLFTKGSGLFCGRDVFIAAYSWLERGTLLESLSDTNIVLIPKCDNPRSMRDLRPISLCNVVYKIMASSKLCFLNVFPLSNLLLLRVVLYLIMPLLPMRLFII